MDGGCGREGYGGGGREGEEMKGGVCQLDVRWRGQGMNELPPSLLPLCRFTCHLHGAVTERVCDLGGGCTPCTACDLHTCDAHSHSFAPPPSLSHSVCAGTAVQLRCRVAVIAPIGAAGGCPSHPTCSSSSLCFFHLFFSSYTSPSLGHQGHVSVTLRVQL